MVMRLLNGLTGLKPLLSNHFKSIIKKYLNQKNKFQNIEASIAFELHQILIANFSYLH